MKRKPLLIGLCLLSTFSACKKSTPVPQDTGKDLVLTAVEQQKVGADNAFALKLFKTISAGNTDNSNLFFSPLSVSFALAMADNGANGQTLTDINNVMNFNGFTQDQVNSYYNKLITELPQLDPNTTLKIANSIWYQQNFTVLPQFSQTNTNYYKAKVQSADFSSSATKDMINAWVSGQTNGKIPTIVDQIPSNVIMYLINAIYFKSTWNEKFNVADTRQRSFYLANGSTVQTDFMSASIHLKVCNDSQTAVVELPYSNSKYSMVIAMPINGNSLQSLSSNLDSVKWQTWMSKLSSIKGDIILPKFKFSYSRLLNNDLISLGMGSAFSDAADFTRINADGGG
ncbi:serpin family protein [Mucilaginibacter paludis]|nr:serpin family protein [Mucilaginibacter paludis]